MYECIHEQFPSNQPEYPVRYIDLTDTKFFNVFKNNVILKL